MAIKKYSDKNLAQSGKPSIIVGSKILPTNEGFYGPYDSLEDAHNSIVTYLKSKGGTAALIPQFLTVGIVQNGKATEYWYERSKTSKELYTVNDLKIKNGMSFEVYSSTVYPDYD